MEEKKRMAVNIAVRCAVDATVEILGYNGARPYFRNIGLLDVFENPPDYDWSPCITSEAYSNLYMDIENIIGTNGAKGVWRRIGYLTIKNGIEKGHLFDSYVSFSKNEKFKKAMELFPVGSGMGRVVDGDNGLAEFDVFDCELCTGRQEIKPLCTVVEGLMQCVSDWAFGKNIYRVKEVLCIAKGDDTCYYKLVEAG